MNANDLNKFAKVFSSMTRCQIMYALENKNMDKMSVYDLAKYIDTTQPNISTQKRKLEELDLIAYELDTHTSGNIKKMLYKKTKYILIIFK